MTEGPYKLPQGWKWVKLGEVWLKPQYGFTASAVNQSVGPKFLRITDIQNGQVNWDTVPYCEIDNELLRKYRLEPGDLLFARIGATTGKSLLIRECPEAIFASYLIRVRVDSSRVLPEFLFYFTQGDLYWSQVDAAKGGRLKQGINIPVLSSFPLPLPPLEEQRRIVARIEELMSRIREAKRLHQEAKEDAGRLMQAALAEVFPRPGAQLPQGWKWVKLGEICLPTERRDPTKEPDRSFLYVDISSVDNGLGKVVDPKELLGKNAPSRARKVIRKDDIIFATTRPYLKNIAIVGIELDNQICSTGFCVLRAKRDTVEPRFLFHVCRSDLVVKQLLGGNMRGASYPAVTDNDVFKSLIPLPPLEEQKRIVAYLEALQEKITALRTSQETIAEDLRRLEQSILDRAFRGEL